MAIPDLGYDDYYQNTTSLFLQKDSKRKGSHITLSSLNNEPAKAAISHDVVDKSLEAFISNHFGSRGMYVCICHRP